MNATAESRLSANGRCVRPVWSNAFSVAACHKGEKAALLQTSATDFLQTI